MTSAQDPQPLTRRQLRELERARAAAAALEAPEAPDLESAVAAPSPESTDAVSAPETAAAPSPYAGEPITKAPAPPPEAPVANVAQLEEESAEEPAGPALEDHGEPAQPRLAETPDHPLTRRELRELLRAQQEQEHGPEGTPPAVGGPSAPEGPIVDPQIAARAAGHWSTMNADAGSVDGVTRSSVATGSVTAANALILPSVPSEGLTTAPLTPTGEVIVTGTVDLPAQLGSTGQHPDHFDTPDIDNLFDSVESQPSTANIAPVRASRVVASQAPAQTTVVPPKSPSSRMPAALAITAGVLAVGVIALVVAAFVFHVF
jgi:hypothetical protein